MGAETEEKSVHSVTTLSYQSVTAFLDTPKSVAMTNTSPQFRIGNDYDIEYPNW